MQYTTEQLQLHKYTVHDSTITGNINMQYTTVQLQVHKYTVHESTITGT